MVIINLVSSVAIIAVYIFVLVLLLRGPLIFRQEIAAIIIFVCGLSLSFDTLVARLLCSSLHFYVGLRLLCMPRVDRNLRELIMDTFMVLNMPASVPKHTKETATRPLSFGEKIGMLCLCYTMVDVVTTAHRLNMVWSPVSAEVSWIYMFLTYYLFGTTMMAGLYLVALCIDVFLITLVQILVKAFNIHVTMPTSDGMFKNPFSSTSPREFWSKNWHQSFRPMFSQFYSTKSAVRTVKAPVKKKSKLNKALSILKVFIVSGLLHEYIFYAITQKFSALEQLAFFAINGLLVATEVYYEGFFKEYGPNNNSNNRLIWQVYTNAIIVLTSPLFFSPYVHHNVLQQQFLPVSVAQLLVQRAE